MGNIQRQLLAEIEAYVRAGHVAESTLGRLALNDGKFVSRLRAGRGITIRSVERIREYIAANPPPKPVAKPRRKPAGAEAAA